MPTGFSRTTGGLRQRTRLREPSARSRRSDRRRAPRHEEVGRPRLRPREVRSRQGEQEAADHWPTLRTAGSVGAGPCSSMNRPHRFDHHPSAVKYAVSPEDSDEDDLSRRDNRLYSFACLRSSRAACRGNHSRISRHFLRESPRGVEGSASASSNQLSARRTWYRSDSDTPNLRI